MHVNYERAAWKWLISLFKRTRKSYHEIKSEWFTVYINSSKIQLIRPLKTKPKKDSKISSSVLFYF